MNVSVVLEGLLGLRLLGQTFFSSERMGFRVLRAFRVEVSFVAVALGVALILSFGLPWTVMAGGGLRGSTPPPSAKKSIRNSGVSPNRYFDPGLRWIPEEERVGIQLVAPERRGSVGFNAMARFLVGRFLGEHRLTKTVVRYEGLVRAHPEGHRWSQLAEAAELSAASYSGGGNQIISVGDVVPKEGAGVLILNHPIAGAEVLATAGAVAEVRPDVMVVLSQQLREIPFLRPNDAAFVDPEGRDQILNLSSFKKISKHLQSGGLLIICPGGEISYRQRGGDFQIQDPPWSSRSALGVIISRMDLPLIPVLVDLEAGALLRWAKRKGGRKWAVSPTMLREMAWWLGRGEMLIPLRWGFPILTSELRTHLPALEDQLPFLQGFLYAMKPYSPRLIEGGSGMLRGEIPPPESWAEVRGAIGEILSHGGEENWDSSARAGAEISRGTRTSYFLDPNPKSGDTGYYIVIVKGDQLQPSLMRELGRQRSLTFRAVGEGGGKGIDLDEHDERFYQILLLSKAAWRRSQKENRLIEEDPILIGGTRFGVLGETIGSYGIDGVYSSGEFSFSKDFLDHYLKSAAELSRTFISVRHQGGSGLSAIWFGVGWLVVELNRQLIHRGEDLIRFLVGSVSVPSGELHPLSRELIRQAILSRSRMGRFPGNSLKEKILDTGVYGKNDWGSLLDLGLGRDRSGEEGEPGWNLSGISGSGDYRGDLEFEDFFLRRRELEAMVRYIGGDYKRLERILSLLDPTVKKFPPLFGLYDLFRPIFLGASGDEAFGSDDYFMMMDLKNPDEQVQRWIKKFMGSGKYSIFREQMGWVSSAKDLVH